MVVIMGEKHIKIRRADLPEVVDGAGYLSIGACRYARRDAEGYWSIAREYVALALHAEATAEREERVALGRRRVEWLRFLRDAAGYAYDDPHRNKMLLQMAAALAGKGLEPPK